MAEDKIININNDVFSHLINSLETVSKSLHDLQSNKQVADLHFGNIKNDISEIKAEIKKINGLELQMAMLNSHLEQLIKMTDELETRMRAVEFDKKKNSEIRKGVEAEQKKNSEIRRTTEVIGKREIRLAIIGIIGSILLSLISGAVNIWIAQSGKTEKSHDKTTIQEQKK